MLFRMTEPKYKPNPVLERALDVLFILHADHEQNCSTSAMRDIGSSHADPYSSLAGAAAALYGPLHGGANEAVLRMLARDRLDQERPGVHQAGQGRRRPADGLRPPRLQVLRPARDDHQADRRPGVRGHGQESAARDRARARAHRARGRVLRLAQALSQRRLLLRPDLPGDGLPGRHVPGALRHPAHRGLDRAVGGDAHRSGAEDRAAAPDLHRAGARATTCRGTSGAEPRPTRAMSHRESPTPIVAGCLVALVAPRAPQAQHRRRRGSTARAPRAPAAAGRHRPARRPARPAPSRRATTSRSSWRPLGLTVEEQPFEASTPTGPIKMVNLRATLPGRRQARGRAG